MGVARVALPPAWVVPREPDSFSGLRHAWADTLRSTGLLPQILQRLGAPDKAAPLSDAELQPFLRALGNWLGVHSDAVWSKCLEITPGQPFRLNLWRILAEISNDPDSAFTDQLSAGVSLGVHCQLQPCTVMAPGLPPDVDPRALECCPCLLWTTSKVGLEKSLKGYLRCVSSIASAP